MGHWFRTVGSLDVYEQERRGRWLRDAVRGIVVVDLTGVLLSTFEALRPLDVIFQIIAYFSAVVFLLEYLYRIVGAARLHKARRYLFSFMGIVDLVCLFPFLCPLFMERGSDLSQLVNFSKVFLIFKLVRYSTAFRTLGDILRAVRGQLQLAIVISSIFMVFSAILMYYVERSAQPEVFSSVGQGFWWAVITMTTVGYGDIYPITGLGKFLAAFIALIGMGMIALPAGIISAAFTSRAQRGPGASSGERCPHCGKPLEANAEADEQKEIKNLAE